MVIHPGPSHSLRTRPRSTLMMRDHSDSRPQRSRSVSSSRSPSRRESRKRNQRSYFARCSEDRAMLNCQRLLSCFAVKVQTCRSSMNNFAPTVQRSPMTNSDPSWSPQLTHAETTRMARTLGPETLVLGRRGTTPSTTVSVSSWDRSLLSSRATPPRSARRSNRSRPCPTSAAPRAPRPRARA